MYHKKFVMPDNLDLIPMKNYILSQMAEAMGMHLVGADNNNVGLLTMDTDGDAGYTLWSSSASETNASCSILSAYKGMQFRDVKIKFINGEGSLISRTAIVRNYSSITVSANTTYYLYYDLTHDGVAFHIGTVPTSKTALNYHNFVTKDNEGRYGYFSMSSYSILNESATNQAGSAGYYMFTIKGERCICTNAASALEGLTYNLYSAESLEDLVVLNNVYVPIFRIYFPDLYIPYLRLADMRVNTVVLETGEEFLIVGLNSTNSAAYSYTPVYYLKM